MSEREIIYKDDKLAVTARDRGGGETEYGLNLAQTDDLGNLHYVRILDVRNSYIFSYKRDEHDQRIAFLRLFERFAELCKQVEEAAKHKCSEIKVAVGAEDITIAREANTLRANDAPLRYACHICRTKFIVPPTAWRETVQCPECKTVHRLQREQDE